MAVQFTRTVTNFDEDLYTHIRQVETGTQAGETISATALSVHNDGANIPTIGVGLNLSHTDKIQAAVIGMAGVILSMFIGAVHADDGADVPNKRYKMWDSRYVPTSNFQLCRELEGILNHPINIERTTWLPDRLFKIPDENRNFRHIKWTKVPKREWGNYYEDKYPDRRTSLYAPLPKGEEQVLEKAYYDADHFEGPQWMVRYKFAPTPFKPWAKPIAHAGGPAKFENNSFGSPFFPPFWYKGRVFNFSGGIREFGGEVSVWEPKVYTNLGTLPKYDDDQVCIFNDNFYAEGK